MPGESIALVCALAVSNAALAQPGSADAVHADPEAESRYLSEIRQMTFADDWAKAGESYFSPDSNWIVFQAVPNPAAGEEPSPHYGMYLAIFADAEYKNGGLERLENKEIVETVQISPPGSANTCGWFSPVPSLAGVQTVLYGSTLTPPSEDNQPGYQRGSGRYRWAFPSEMEIVKQQFVRLEEAEAATNEFVIQREVNPTVIFERPGYTAECSYSPDARHILYAHVDEAKSNELGRPDANLWVYDTETEAHTILVEAEGYDGGPFFSPDGKWICYRSDRRGDNLLQLFVAELAYDDAGRITGIEREIQLTDNQHVNWAPFWHPSGEFLVYASSEVSHRNYEVFALPFDAENPEAEHEPVRITYAEGFDGLPVFSPDGAYMMWTAQRGGDRSPDGRASSQLWIAKWNGLGVGE